jgi:drug/metabolite transporter (DMT)-like permease
MTHAPSARLGVALMAGGMFLFAVNDTLGKWLVASHSVGQVLLIRSLAALVFLAPMLWVFGLARLFTLERPGLQALRVVLSTAEVFCFYLAVRDLPLADVMTFWLAAPVYVAALSPLLLGERVRPLTWAAILLGFVGVLVALSPSGTMSGTGTLASIIGSACFAAMMITGRSLRGTPDTALVFWQLVGAALAGAVTAPLGWTQPSGTDWVLLGALGIVAMGAHLCVTRALKLADAATVAPLQYTLLPWAMVLGWLAFGDVPRPVMLLAGGAIVLAGLMLALGSGPHPATGSAPRPRWSLRQRRP